MKIAILGAGAFGTTLGGILAANGYGIDYYDSKIERERLRDVLAGAKYVVLAVPSKVAPYLLPHLPKDVPLVIATKGFLSDAAFLDFRDFMILSGPGFAEDIKSKKRTKLTITDRRLAELFRAEYLEFDLTEDRKGVLMCGALKNVYAILAGISGLERESVEWKQFILEATGEIKEILKLNGAEEKTAELACGISDLELTCGLPSRNYEFGQKLRENEDYRPEKTVEGFTALEKIKRGELKIPENAAYLRKLMDLSEKWY